MVSTYMYDNIYTEQANTRTLRVIYEQTCFTHSVCTRSFSSTSHGCSNARTCTNICVFHEREASVVTLVSVANIKQRAYLSNVRQITTSLHLYNEFDCHILMYVQKGKKFILTDCYVYRRFNFLDYQISREPEKKNDRQCRMHTCKNRGK